MRSKLGLSAATVAILALAMMAFGSPVALGDGEDDGTTVRLKAEEEEFAFFDLGDSGFSIGDELVFSDKLWRDDKEIGEDGVKCVLTHVIDFKSEEAKWHCIGTLWFFKWGQITVQGLLKIKGEDDEGPFTLAITGGTDKFRDASGELVVEQENETTATYKLHLDRDWP